VARVLLDGVKKVYDGGVVAVHGISLEVKDKEFAVLVGPSGCGKSTTLRMVAGLEEVSEGKIFIDDLLVNDVPPKDRDIAMVFQNYALYPHMTVYQNMAFGLKLRKFRKNEIDQRVHEAASILGIEELLQRKPKALSGGQRQRVAVGRAIVRKPKVFLFDEPLSNLDAKLRVQMRTEISKLHHQLGTTMIYVTHDQTEAMTMGNKIVLMKGGFVQQIATPLEIYHKPENKFVAGFIGSPAMNFFGGTLQKGKGKAGALKFQADGSGGTFAVHGKMAGKLRSFAGKRLVLGIRPEHIAFRKDARTMDKPSPLRVKVEVVEPMGNETYLYFSMGRGGENAVARVQSTEEIKVGKPADLVLDMAKAHFFDPETEQAIR